MNYHSSLTDVRHHVHRTADGGLEEHEQIVNRADPATRTLAMAQRIVYLAFGVLTGLLVLRFALALFAANPANPFADFVYTLTGPFVHPFVSLFGINTRVDGGGRFELETLMAIIAYSLLAWVLITLLAIPRGTTDEAEDM